MNSFKADIKQYFDKLSDVIRTINIDQIDSAMNVIMDAYDKKAKVFVFGNGGSSAIASHLTGDFNICLSKGLKKKFEFVCLNDNVPTMMAISNDHGYENVFLDQIADVARKGDVILAISGSGNSENVIRAAEYAKKNNVKIVAMVGYDGGKLIKLADNPIHVNINDMQKTEDVFTIISHIMFQTFRKLLGNGSNGSC